MKKIYIFLIMMAMVFTHVSAGNDLAVEINKKNINVKTCSVEIDGKKLSSNYYSYVKDGRTFVPIREITEALGASVYWDNQKKTVLITLNDKNVKLKIGSGVVFIDEEKKKIDENSIPVLVTYTKLEETKTMVPLRFISEAFGYNVNWDGKNLQARVDTLNTESLIGESEKNRSDKKDKKKNAIKSKKNDKSKANTLSYNVNSIVKNHYQSSEEIKETKYLTEKIYEDENEDALKAVGLDLEDVERKQVINDKLFVEGKVKIIIDPGHGGKDSGCLSKDEKVYEKDLTLKIANKLYDKLLQDGLDVSLTRNRDEFIKLQDRASLSNETNANLFLSIHINSSEKTDPNGIEVLYASEKNIKIKSNVQKHFANELQKALIKETGAEDRGIKNRPALIVLNQTKTVAALAELGFITNDEELNNLLDESYIDKLVDGLYKGCRNYIDKYVEY